MTLNVPRTTSNGLQLTDFYDIRIDVNTDDVPSGALPSGRRSIFGSDLMDIVQKVRNEVIEIFPTGDQAIDT